MNKENEYHIEVYEDSGKEYVLLEDLQAVLKAGQEIQRRINKAIEYIEEYCIDDEFYVNLTKKEKSIIEVLHILEGEDDVSHKDSEFN